MHKDRKKTADSNKSAECHPIEKTEPIHRWLSDTLAQILVPMRMQSLMRYPFIAANKEREQNSRYKDRTKHDSKHSVPAHALSQSRGEEHRQHRAAVGRSGNAHRQALVLRRIGTAGNRKRHRKAGSCHAKEEAHAEQLNEVPPTPPTPQQRSHLAKQKVQAGRLCSHAVAAQADPHSKKRSAQKRAGTEQSFLRRRESELFRDRHAQRADQEPAHKADFKMQPCTG